MGSGCAADAAGCRERAELGAREKLTMCLNIRAILKEVRAKFQDKTESFIQNTYHRAVRKAFPCFRRSSDIEKFLKNEGFAREVAIRNRLGRDLSNPVGGRGQFTSASRAGQEVSGWVQDFASQEQVARTSS